MKSKTKILCLALTMACTSAFATVWRVNNRAGIDADFATLSAAHTGAAAGDTLYLEGSPFTYGNLTLAKQLVIMGAGYFLTINDTTQAYKLPSTVGLFTFNVGSENSVITGLSMGRVYINTYSITIRRCYIYYTSTDECITINAKDSTEISQCYIWQNYTSNSTSYSAINLIGSCNNTLIRNNIIRKRNNTFDYHCLYMTSSSTFTLITNNVIYGTFYAYNATIVNNIQGIGTFVNGNITFPNIVTNNIGNSTQFGTADGNQINVLMTTVFTQTGSQNNDEWYKLKVLSPALGAGFGGADCGVYDETDNSQYFQSGMPEIPSIFDATVDPIGNGVSGLNGNLKSISHK